MDNEKRSSSIHDVDGPDPRYFLKIGRRYYPADRFTGFPVDGLWFVQSDKGSRRSACLKHISVEKVSDLPEPYVEKRGALEMRRDEVTEALDKIAGKVSLFEIVNVLFDVLSSPVKSKEK